MPARGRTNQRDGVLIALGSFGMYLLFTGLGINPLQLHILPTRDAFAPLNCRPIPRGGREG